MRSLPPSGVVDNNHLQYKNQYSIFPFHIYVDIQNIIVFVDFHGEDKNIKHLITNFFPDDRSVSVGGQ